MSELRFALVVDGEFGIAITINDSHPNYDMLVALTASDPKVVVIPEDHPDYNNIKLGWTYIDGDWVPPAE